MFSWLLLVSKIHMIILKTKLEYLNPQTSKSENGLKYIIITMQIISCDQVDGYYYL